MKATNKINVNVGSLADMGQRFTSAWNRAASGKKFNETNVTFLNVQTMLEALSPRRLDLLRHLRQQGAESIKELSEDLRRDYKNVYQDVIVLETAGLLVRQGRKISTPWDELHAHVSLT